MELNKEQIEINCIEINSLVKDLVLRGIDDELLLFDA